MILFWKTGPLGRLGIEESVLREQVDSCLPEGMACTTVQLVGEHDLLNVFVSFPAGENAPDAESLNTALTERFSPLGLKPAVSLVAGEPEIATGKNRHPLLKSLGDCAVGCPVSTWGFRAFSGSFSSGSVPSASPGCS